MRVWVMGATQTWPMYKLFLSCLRRDLLFFSLNPQLRNWWEYLEILDEECGSWRLFKDAQIFMACLILISYNTEIFFKHPKFYIKNTKLHHANLVIVGLLYMKNTVHLKTFNSTNQLITQTFHTYLRSVIEKEWQRSRSLHGSHFQVSYITV